MVQFMTSTEMESLYQALKPKGMFDDFLLNDPKKAPPTQQDALGFFHSYYTTSTKKPYVWNRFDMYYGVAPGNFGEYFELCLKTVNEAKSTHDWTGYKVVAVCLDLLNPNHGMALVPQYCTEVFSPKKKTYINGAKANTEFLAKKGKHF